MGQEPYSLAILLDRIIPDINQWNINIIGTDINQDFLKIARTGIYKDWSLRAIDPYLKSRYFDSIHGQWQIKNNIKKTITFCQDNIVRDNLLPAFCHGVDLILCRNVFIYFETDSINKGLNKFYYALNPQAYLMTAHAELQGSSLDGFKTLHFPTSIIYQRLENGTRHIDGFFAQK